MYNNDRVKFYTGNSDSSFRDACTSGNIGGWGDFEKICDIIESNISKYELGSSLQTISCIGGAAYTVIMMKGNDQYYAFLMFGYADNSLYYARKNNFYLVTRIPL